MGYLDIKYGDKTHGITRDEFHEFCDYYKAEIYDLFKDQIEEDFADSLREYFADDADDAFALEKEQRQIEHGKFKED
jgi:hypothetical protein